MGNQGGKLATAQQAGYPVAARQNKKEGGRRKEDGGRRNEAKGIKEEGQGGRRKQGRRAEE